MKEDTKISFIDDNNTIKSIIIIDRFTKNNKNYLIYYEENDENEIYSSLYEIENNKLKIIPITEEKDYDIVDEYLRELK